MIRSNDMGSDFQLRPYLAERQDCINQALAEFIEAGANQLNQAMQYSLMAGGKRLRPILCMAAAEAVGDTEAGILDTACALEMIHTYSLIHDDLPAMDDDNLRRGKPTCHKVYGEATAILAGDALLTLAFQVLSALPKSTVSQTTTLKIISKIALAAGFQGMICGQHLDMIAEKRSLSIEHLKHMHGLKTGALIEASVYAGAILAEATATQVQQLEHYARNIGLAFQVTDDILNVEGDSELMGKAVGTDQERKKSTYPSLLGLDASRAYAQDLIEDALRALAGFDGKATPLRALARYVIERKR